VTQWKAELSTKFQAPSSREAPKAKLQAGGILILKFGAWSFSGAWCLEFGASADIE
jgi:hypothetical protein